ncbi:MAG TPA: phytanoyl-CoA dioxygenase family protein [Bryobacteraceae bacterium]|nr:phytanoyl-CoA dioxygenase family protein [Bryobacteraceae bacterium]
MRYNLAVTAEEKRLLQEQGYLIVRGLMDGEWLSELCSATGRLLDEEGDGAGGEFRKEAGSDRLANLVDKGATFRRLVSHPVLLEAAEAVLGADWKLSSLNYRAALPGDQGLQPLHCDMGLTADAMGNAVFNSIWMLDDFTEENGPTRLVPGSHRSGQLPQDALADPRLPHPDEIVLLGRAGDVIFMNSHLWHGGTANRTALPRRSLHGFFVRGDQPQQQYQKRLLRPETQAALSPLMRRILALDDARNDALSAAGSGRSGFLK